MDLQAKQVDVSPGVIVLALIAGTLTAVMAALVPAMTASGENPAAAVRRIRPFRPGITVWRRLFSVVPAWCWA